MSLACSLTAESPQETQILADIWHLLSFVRGSLPHCSMLSTPQGCFSGERAVVRKQLSRWQLGGGQRERLAQEPGRPVPCLLLPRGLPS